MIVADWLAYILGILLNILAIIGFVKFTYCLDRSLDNED